MRMKTLFNTLVSTQVKTLGVLLLASSIAHADGLSKKEYAEKYSLYGMKSSYGPAVEACLRSWGKSHPFKDQQKIKFRLMQGQVKVFGVGNNIVDDTPTQYPQLIVVRPGVNVMGNMNYELLNPNGWYCLKAKVNVMGKSVINLACNAQIASTSGTTIVMGAGEGQSGTTVMGKTVVNRICDEGEEL